MLKLDISSAIGDYIDQMDGRMAEVLAQSADYVADQMAGRQRELAPRAKNGGGSLEQSIHPEPSEVDGWKVAAATSAGVHYAFFQEYGTGSKGDATTFDGTPILHTDKERWTYVDAATGEFRTAYPMAGKHFMSDEAKPETLSRQMRNEIIRRLNQ